MVVSPIPSVQLFLPDTIFWPAFRNPEAIGLENNSRRDQENDAQKA
jgi:hypothetical protein